MGACLDRHSQIGNFFELVALKKSSIFLLVQRVFPSLVGRVSLLSSAIHPLT